MVISEETHIYCNEPLNLLIKNLQSAKNHVHETMDRKQNEIMVISSSDSEKGKKKEKKSKTCNKEPGMPISESQDDAQVTQISEDDLEELRTVYKKCKAVMKKIETKYGHLLNLEDKESRKRKNKSPEVEESSDIKCECSANKKILFDDEGTEITTETDLGNHICMKRLKRTRSTDHVNVSNVQIEHESPDTTLPDDLLSLTNILHDTEIENTYRNKVIKKLKLLRQEFMDEIRFNKQSLIEKIKLDPDEMLEFQGTNLKSLPGYVVI